MGARTRRIPSPRARQSGINHLGRASVEITGRLVDVLGTDELGALDSYAVARSRADEARRATATGPERDFRSRIAEHADRSGDVVDAEADVVKAFTVLVEPDGERRVARERLHELYE